MENWKLITDFNYSISNEGRIRNEKTGRITLGSIDSRGYHIVRLTNKETIKSFPVHQLVAIYFLNHQPDGHKLIVDHKDFNKSNNNVNNLQIITQSENVNRWYNKNYKSKGSSKWIGVTKTNKGWKSTIRFEGKNKFLGYFINEEDAGLAYLEFKNKYKNKLIYDKS